MRRFGCACVNGFVVHALTLVSPCGGFLVLAMAMKQRISHNSSTIAHNSHLSDIPTTTASNEDSHSLRTAETSQVIHSILPHDQNSCQLRFSCVRILWQRTHHHCFGICHHLQLSQQGVSLQAHPFPPFCLRSSPSSLQTNICVLRDSFAKDSCRACATKSPTCTS